MKCASLVTERAVRAKEHADKLQNKIDFAREYEKEKQDELFAKIGRKLLHKQQLFDSLPIPSLPLFN